MKQPAGIEADERSRQVYAVMGRSHRDFAACAEILAGLPAQLTVLPFIQDADELIEATRDADALIVTSTHVTRDVMTALDRLKVVVRTGVGFDVIDVAAATELGVVVVNIPDLWIEEVANHAVGLLLALNRKLPQLDRRVKEGTWVNVVPGTFTGSIYGETVGIVGLGNIGSAFARRMTAFDARLVGYDPYVDDAHFEGLGVERVSLEELAERADYISVHTLLNEETHHLVGNEVFSRTKPNAILVNTARGPVVDELALHAALTEGRLAGAALDVWENEPAVPDHPLLALDNVIASSHAAYYSSPAVARVPGRCGEEVTRALKGERPLNVVNAEVFEPGAFRRA